MAHALFNKEAKTNSPLAPTAAPVELGRQNQVFNAIRDTRRNVEINIGKACNNRCVFCIDGLPKREDRSYMAWEEMERELRHWHEAGTRSVGFLGGEPTTYPHIVQAIGLARDLGYTRIALATNATKLRLQHFTDKCLEAGLTRVTISMHGHTGPLEDKITRVPGVFEKKCDAIRYLNQKKKEGFLADGLSVNIVLNGWNYRHLLHMMKFFYLDLELDDLRINFVRPEGYAEGDPDITPRYQAVVPLLRKALYAMETAKEFRGKTFTFGGFPLCVLPPVLRDNDALLKKYMGEYRDLSTDCSVRQDGDGFGIEEIKDGRSRFNWQDRKRFDLKHAPDACHTCTKVALCEGVWKGYVDIHGQGEFQAI
ncbi:MAG: radical SAM protein [Alphaproteobacteria bacterium]|nr:radical SAM protein [Alphaproteobacteria bacterium]